MLYVLYSANNSLTVYMHINRTIPSDDLQARGIVLLCQQFNWTKIAVVYVQDAYGLYLSIGISSGALDHDIEVISVGFARDELSTYDEAALQIQRANVYIIVFVVHDSDILPMFESFEAIGLTGYPYLYIGVDAWFDSPTISGKKIEKYAQGTIGTVPWQTDAMPLSAYDDALQPLINESMQIYNNLLDSWTHYWNAGYSANLYTETPSTTAIYGYDSMYTLAHALQLYLDRNTGHGHINVRNLNISLLNDIIINEIAFTGASGEVKFDSNGDRAEGLYAFGNVLNDSTVAYFGYFNEFNVSVNYENIVWPNYFTERGMQPRSSMLTIDEIVDISEGVLVPMYILCVLSMLVTLFLMAMSFKYREESVLRAASWKINQIMVVGSVFGYVAMIIYGIDEQSVSENRQVGWMWLCNLRLWMWVLSYTLLFVPLFAKTYRLSRIFNEILEKKYIHDSDLVKGIIFCLVVDFVLLTMYTAIEPLQRMYISLNYEQIDELQRVHYIYGSCETNNNSQYIFCALIALWKCIESLFGIYCALSVSRFAYGYGHRALSQFDETAQQLLSIIFLIVALCIAAPVYILGSDHPSIFYGVVGFLTISVGNVTTLLNLFPRIYALMRGNAEAKYSQSPQEKMESLIMAQLKKYGVDNEWWHRQKNTMDGSHASVKTTSTNKGHTSGISKDVSNVALTIPTQVTQTFHSAGAMTPRSDEIVLPVVSDENITIRGLDKKISAGSEENENDNEVGFEKKISATPTHTQTNSETQQ